MNSPKSIATSFNGQKITFVESDRNEDETIIQVAKEVIEIMSINKSLMEFLMDVIYEYHLSEIGNSFTLLSDKINIQKELYPMFLTELLTFRSKYLSLFNPEKVESLNEPDKTIYIDKVNKIRGTILELILERKVNKQFDDYMTGCYVDINGKKISYNGKQSVDLAGHNRKECRFYECKIVPEGFNYNDGPKQLNLLFNIKNALQKCAVRSNIYCVSAGPKLGVEASIKYNIPQYHFEFIAMGRSELL